MKRLRINQQKNILITTADQKSNKTLKRVTAFAMVVAIVSTVCNGKVFAFYNIDALVGRVQQEIQSFADGFSAQSNQEINDYKSRLEAQTNQEIEAYEKNLVDQASKEIKDSTSALKRESQARIDQEIKESGERIKKLQDQTKSEIDAATKSLN